jgi:hypothetical protein
MQNHAEGTIREMKKRWYRSMIAKQVPKRLWDYGLVYGGEIMQRTANGIYDLRGRTPLEELTGETPNIAEYLGFGFYDWCWFKENAGLGPEEIGRWLDVSHRIGNLMTYWIIKSNGQVVSRSTVQRIPDLEIDTDRLKTLCSKFTQHLNERLADVNFRVVPGAKDQPTDWGQMVLDTDPDFADAMQKVDFVEDIFPEHDAHTAGSFDAYLAGELAMPRDDDPQYAKGTKRLRDKDGRPIGTAHDNPILDTRMYEVEFLDGHTEALSANDIAENMFAQVDEEGHRHVILQEIVDHKRDHQSITADDAFITSSNGVRRRKETTIGWELLVQRKDGSTSWIPLKDMKNSYPVQTAEYAVANRISKEPAFA